MAARRHVLAVSLPCGVERAWRIASATDRLDAQAGMDSILYRDEPQQDGTSRRFFSTRTKGIRTTGEEFPFTWEAPRSYEVLRSYDRGPFHTSRHHCVVEPVGSGSLITMTFDLQPRGVLGQVFNFGFPREVLPAMEAAMRQAERDPNLLPVGGGEPRTEASDPARARPEVARRLDELMPEARALGDSPLLDRLRELLITGDDYDLQRIRPIACARAWGVQPAELTDAFLAATHAGILNLRWDVICPHCRGDKQNLASLDAVRPNAFCPACNVRFDVDLDRSLEAVFAPHPQVRSIEVARYCLGGPGTTPHVRVQRLMQPGERWEPTLTLEEGRYRIRATGTDRYRWVSVEAGAAVPTGPAEIVLEAAGLLGDDLRLPVGHVLPAIVENRTDRKALVVIEEVAWARDAMPASDLVADERFRLLFSRQMLAPGVSLAVENVTILFTDLVGSTAMYGILGDARAFGLVWNHFDLLRQIVDERRGATVKTIGDAIMAAFPRAEDAVDVAAELHDRISQHLAAHGHDYRTALKIGMHAGPCIVVTLNDRLDYFGTTVNLAARVEGQSEGGDIVVSEATLRRAGGPAMLEGRGWKAERFDAAVKGFDQTVPMVRFVRG